MNKNGSLVLSLDYELMWGCRDWATPQDYGMSNIINVPKVIDGLLDLFAKYDVRATFAVVGMIMCADKNELLRNIPSTLPMYDDLQKSPYSNHYIENINDEFSCMYFSQKTIQKLMKSPNIEIGTHTFSHYYCWEKGQTVEQFESDLQCAIKMANNIGINMSSIVFPKNMVSNEYLKICIKYGISQYRGNALKYFNEPKNNWESIKNRICRLLDAYINIGGYTSIPYDRINYQEGMLNVCASRMLRPYSPKLSFLEKFRLRRIQKEIIYAAQKGEMYHLWWHPHNFGAYMRKNLSFLEEILKTYKECHDKYGMKSFTIKEISKQI